MDKKTIHIVALEIPYPPEKGSAIDMFYRLKALAAAGVEIILHCYYKTFRIENDLAQYCKVVYLYARKPIWQIQSLSIPLFVQSRQNDQLVEVLSRDDHPIFFEGLHTTYSLNDKKLKNKKKYIRLHNVEAAYYHHLRVKEKNVFNKIYYSFETRLINKCESKILFDADHLFAISELECGTYKSLGYNVTWLPPFIDNSVTSLTGLGNYALYHGDLSIKENETAVLFLIEKVFKELNYPLSVAGKNPSSKLKARISKNKYIQLHANPSPDQMETLIREAHIILVPFYQTAGYKIKLLESLAKGRHIITTPTAMAYRELTPYLHFASVAKEWIELIRYLKGKEFSEEDKVSRVELMDQWFDPKVNAESLIEKIFE